MSALVYWSRLSSKWQRKRKQLCFYGKYLCKNVQISLVYQFSAAWRGGWRKLKIVISFFAATTTQRCVSCAVLGICERWFVFEYSFCLACLINYERTVAACNANASRFYCSYLPFWWFYVAVRSISLVLEILHRPTFCETAIWASSERCFPWGCHRDFFKGADSGEISFYQFETKIKRFSIWRKISNFEILPGPCFSLSDAHGQQ